LVKAKCAAILLVCEALVKQSPFEASQQARSAPFSA